MQRVEIVENVFEKSLKNVKSTLKWFYNIIKLLRDRKYLRG